MRNTEIMCKRYNCITIGCNQNTVRTRKIYRFIYFIEKVTSAECSRMIMNRNYLLSSQLIRRLFSCLSIRVVLYKPVTRTMSKLNAPKNLLKLFFRSPNFLGISGKNFNGVRLIHTGLPLFTHPPVTYEEIVELPSQPYKLLIDVRQSGDFKNLGSIPGAINIPRKSN